MHRRQIVLIFRWSLQSRSGTFCLRADFLSCPKEIAQFFVYLPGTSLTKCIATVIQINYCSFNVRFCYWATLGFIPPKQGVWLGMGLVNSSSGLTRKEDAGLLEVHVVELSLRDERVIQSEVLLRWALTLEVGSSVIFHGLTEASPMASRVHGGRLGSCRGNYHSFRADLRLALDLLALSLRHSWLLQRALPPTWPYRRPLALSIANQTVS